MPSNQQSSLLSKIKLSLSILDNAADDIIRQKINEARDYLKSLGISFRQINSDLGTTAITLYVNDFWTVGGKIEESPAFWTVTSRLYSNSRADETEVTAYILDGGNAFTEFDEAGIAVDGGNAFTKFK